MWSARSGPQTVPNSCSVHLRQTTQMLATSDGEMYWSRWDGVVRGREGGEEKVYRSHVWDTLKPRLERLGKGSK